MTAYYCKGCRIAVAAVQQANSCEKVARFRSGYVSALLGLRAHGKRQRCPDRRAGRRHG